jgi:hypothetical protein
MSVAGGMVTITQAATSMRGFFDAAEDVQVNKVRGAGWTRWGLPPSSVPCEHW